MTHLTRTLHPLIAALDSLHPQQRKPAVTPPRQLVFTKDQFESGDHRLVTLPSGTRTVVTEGDCRQGRVAPIIAAADFGADDQACVMLLPARFCTPTPPNPPSRLACG